MYQIYIFLPSRTHIDIQISSFDRILERTSALVLELLQREEELKKARAEVRLNLLEGKSRELIIVWVYHRLLMLQPVNNV